MLIIKFGRRIVMTLSEKMQRMTEMLYRFGADLKKNDDSCKCYIAPDIPEKIIKNLIKNYILYLMRNLELAQKRQYCIITLKQLW